MFGFSVVTLFVCSSVYAQSGGGFEITNSTINSGGSSSGGQFELVGTIGQYDAGGAMSAGSFELTGGFWSGNNDLIFKNDFE